MYIVHHLKRLKTSTILVTINNSHSKCWTTDSTLKTVVQYRELSKYQKISLYSQKKILYRVVLTEIKDKLQKYTTSIPRFLIKIKKYIKNNVHKKLVWTTARMLFLVSSSLSLSTAKGNQLIMFRGVQPKTNQIKDSCYISFTKEQEFNEKQNKNINSSTEI